MNYYEVLGIKNDASVPDIRLAYHNMVKAFHPDYYHGNKEFAQRKTAEINEAYFVLKDPVKRKRYDDWLSNHEYLKNDTQQNQEQQDQEMKWEQEEKEHKQQETEWQEKQDQWHKEEEQAGTKTKSDNDATVKNSTLVQSEQIGKGRKIGASIVFFVIIEFFSGVLIIIMSFETGYDFQSKTIPLDFAIADIASYVIAMILAVYTFNHMTKQACKKICMINCIIASIIYAFSGISRIFRGDNIDTIIAIFAGAIAGIYYALKLHNEVYKRI